MGCDIHTMAEIQQYSYADNAFIEGKWKAVKDQLFEYPYFREGEPISPQNVPRTSRPYVGRNYALFSVLADVRNSRTTHNIFDPSMEYEERDAIEPIDLPRGIPEDASKAWRKECKHWGVDFHSHSWFTVRELVDAVEAGAFSQTIISRGYVGLGDYLAHKNEGKEIESWSSYAGGGDTVAMTELEWLGLPEEKQREYIATVREGGNRWFSPVYIRYAWVVNTGSWLTEFVEKTIPALVGMAPQVYRRNDKGGYIRDEKGRPVGEPNLDAIRLVFAFDN